MLTKKDIITTIKKLNLSVEDYYITAGTALVLYGIRENTKDIDLAVSEKLWNIYLEKGFLPNSINNNLMEISKDIEFIKNWKADNIIQLENLPVISLESLIKQKEQLGRDKDFKDIELIKTFLNKI